ncbi:MAG: cation diffusion facilitator family transporter [Oscillospiraceae bacterium]|nr:cation diffusion facilitator family transporter [Oscillospiraceae bacterium]
MEKNNIREQQITRTSLIGIAANLLLAGFKAAVGLLAGSIAIVLDAVNNTTDALSSVITILGVKLAKRRPDEKHPFGYGRIEYLSAVVISAIVLSAGATSLIESVKAIITPTTPEHNAVTLSVIAVAVVVKLLLGRFVKAQGEKYNSEALVASGSDASFDAIISASTLVGALITLLFHVSIDGWLGAVISVFILKAGFEMLLDSFNDIMGKRPDSEITRQIRACAADVPGVLGAYDLILHNYGPNSAIGSIHVEVPDTLDARSLNAVTQAVQNTVLENFHVFLTVGFYVIDTSRQADIDRINAIATAHPGALGTHGVNFDDERRRLSFDVLVDFTVHDKAGLCEAIRGELSPVFPGYDIVINCDTNYSD